MRVNLQTLERAILEQQNSTCVAYSPSGPVRSKHSHESPMKEFEKQPEFPWPSLRSPKGQRQAVNRASLRNVASKVCNNGRVEWTSQWQVVGLGRRPQRVVNEIERVEAKGVPQTGWWLRCGHNVMAGNGARTKGLSVWGHWTTNGEGLRGDAN